MVHFPDKNSNPPLHLFIKICASKSQAEFFNSLFHTFDTEIGFYEHVKDELLSCEKDDGIDIFTKSQVLPKYHRSAKIGTDLHVIMEDFMLQGKLNI